MKKIINGKLYNTETAEQIAAWSNGCNHGDFHQCKEALYKTKAGQFFLAGSGGAMSKYAESCGTNSWCGSDGMELLGEGAALDWCERHDIDADKIAKHFAVTEG